MKDQVQGTFFTHKQLLTIKDVLPMFKYLGLSEDETALFLGMRPKSPYAEKYLANEAQELNHLQLYACGSLDQLITLGINKMSRQLFNEWMQTPHTELGNQTPKEWLMDLTKHDSLSEILN